MEQFPKIFIVILNYNGKNFIKKTLTDVFKINYPNFEVVLVDNNSNDGSFELIKSNFSKIALIKNSTNLGFSGGNNIGIEYALERGADFVLLLNYDTEVEKNFLFPLVEIMEKDKKVGLASPVIFEKNSKKIWFSGGKISWLKMKTYHTRKPISKNFFNSDYISGCSMLIRKKVFEDIGLLDDTFFLYWEDADFSLRAKKAKHKMVVCPKSKIYHLEKSQENIENKTYWLVISGLIFFKKNSPFFIRPWIFLYFRMRKIKNYFDIKSEKEEKELSIKRSVQKAYKDFKYVE
jgi:GT2 family glycosyltransferase